MSFGLAFFMSEFDRIRRKVDELNGVGVVNDPDGISISPPPPEPGTAPGDSFNPLYSKISSPWSSNTANIMLGIPCDDTGGSTNSTALRLNLISPTTATPGQQCYLTTGDVVQYLPYSPKIGSGTNALDGLIVAWDQRGGTNSIGTKLYQVFQMTGTATAGWDWPMAHNLP